MRGTRQPTNDSNHSNGPSSAVAPRIRDAAPARGPAKHRERWTYRSTRSKKYFAPLERSWRYLPEWSLFRPPRGMGCREGFWLGVRGLFLLSLHLTYARIWRALSRQRAGRF